MGRNVDAAAIGGETPAVVGTLQVACNHTTLGEGNTTVWAAIQQRDRDAIRATKQDQWGRKEGDSPRLAREIFCTACDVPCRMHTGLFQGFGDGFVHLGATYLLGMRFVWDWVRRVL